MWITEARRHGFTVHRVSLTFPPDPWLLGAARAYAAWTSVANGSGLESDDQVDGIPAEWNGVYFDLLANCLPGMDSRDIDKLALTTITSLPDEVFFDVVAYFLRSVDEVYYGDGDLQASEAVRIRSVLADRLTSSSGWCRLRHEKSTSIEVHIGPAIAAFFFNDYSRFQPPKCYLMPPGIDRLDPFIPVLERLADSGPCFLRCVLCTQLGRGLSETGTLGVCRHGCRGVVGEPS